MMLEGMMLEGVQHVGMQLQLPGGLLQWFEPSGSYCEPRRALLPGAALLAASHPPSLPATAQS